MTVGLHKKKRRRFFDDLAGAGAGADADVGAEKGERCHLSSLGNEDCDEGLKLKLYPTS